MAASVPAFPGHGGPFLAQSLSTKLGKQQWKALGAASALALGLMWTESNALAVATKKAALEKALEKAIVDSALEDYCPFVGTFSPFASLSISSITTLENSVEPKTGTSFPVELPEGKQLTGIGLRRKNILGLKKINVYAYGVYADLDSLKSMLGGKYDIFTPSELSTKEEFFRDITESDVELTVRLNIVYGKLKSGTIRSAFEESVGKGLKKFSGHDNKELLARFTSAFTEGLKLPKGTTIDITRLPGQVLRTKIDGQEVGNVQSALLCQAVLDLYIGEESFDKTARETMGRGFASLLSS